jgi:hypothetical protein
MKLYEFSYTDNLNQTEAEVLVRVAEFLDSEADQQGWAAGHNFRQCRTVEQLVSGERRYHFEVLGEYSAGDGENQDVAIETGAAAALPPVAAASNDNESYAER